MNSYLEKLLNGIGEIQQYPYSAVPCHYNSLGLTKSITWETGILLKNFVEYKRPKQICELGTFRGYSTCWLVVGTILNGFGNVCTYDIQPEGLFGKMWYDHYELPKDNLNFHHIPGGIAKNPQYIPGKIDFLFHDSSHELDDTQSEMEALLPRIPQGGIIVFDDMLHPDYKPMQGYLYDLFANKPNWKFCTVAIGTGLGIAERLR